MGASPEGASSISPLAPHTPWLQRAAVLERGMAHATLELGERHHSASALLASVRDIVDERALGNSPPSWSTLRGWTGFLEALSDGAVIMAQRDGLAAHVAELPGAPADLVTLARAVSQCVMLPRARARDVRLPEGRKASERKRAQVAAFGALLDGFATRPARIVDVGSGHGHLTRHLARTLAVPAEGWERDPARVAVAERLTSAQAECGARTEHEKHGKPSHHGDHGDHGDHAEHGPRFITVDVHHAPNDFTSDDLLVGLHACGDLADHAVLAAGHTGAAVALIGCCLQKRAAERLPLAETPLSGSLTLARSVLGLGNARDGEDGVEADLASRNRSRVHRIALRISLQIAGFDVRPGEEMRGLNRRRATGSLVELVARAFALRARAAPAPHAIAEAERAAYAEYARTSRWELPRTMLARLVETWVALDRARYLSTRGYRAEVVVAFPPEVSPRNLAVLATR